MNQYDENVRELPSEQKIVIHTKRSTRSLLQNLTHSLHLGFPHWVKVILSAIGPAMARYKVNCFHLLVACSQSSFQYFCVDKFSHSGVANLLPVLVNSVRQLHRYLMRCAIQLKPLKLKAPKAQLIGMWRFLFSGLEFMLSLIWWFLSEVYSINGGFALANSLANY